jgi:hypothetical protein
MSASDASLKAAESVRGEGIRLHPAWLRLFTYVRRMRNGVIDRLVIQDRAPVFMERVHENVSLSGETPPVLSDTVAGTPSDVACRGPEWTNLIGLAARLAFCEFHRITIENGVPTVIGAVVNKEKLS